MKNVIVSFVISLFFICVSFAQTVDEILAEHYNAVGQEKLLATNTLMMKGKIVQQSFEIPFTSFQKRPMNFRSKPGLGRWGESFVSTFLFQTHPLVSGLAVWSLLKAWKKRDKRYLITGGLLLMVFVCQIRRMRYILPLFPMLTLMASYGLQHVRESNTRKFVASCIVLSSLTLAYVAYLPFCRTMSAANIRDTGMFLDAMGIDKAEVTLVYNREVSLNPAVVVPLLDFFTKATLHHVPDGPIPVPEESVERSPLRFTWEYELPGYYGESVRGEPDTVMVISDDPEGMLPDALSQRLGNYRLLEGLSQG